MEYKDIHRELVKECMRGDRQAQFKLYQLYSQAMYNICLRMVRNETDAEDLLQNSFIDVFTKLDTFRYRSTIGAWIKRIVVNNCINFLKKRKIYFEEIDERITEREDQQSPNDFLDDDPNVREEALSVAAIKEAIYRLPDGYRVVFSLYQMEGYDHKEIAQILHISEQTSKSQYSRARKKLKELLLSQPSTTG